MGGELRERVERAAIITVAAAFYPLFDSCHRRCFGRLRGFSRANSSP